jgi:FixJ family two-component response regulator
VQRPPDALVGLSADDEKSPDAASRELALKRRLFKRVAVLLLDPRLPIDGHELRHKLPRFAAALKVVVIVLYPDDRHVRRPRPVDEL